jgi:predicted nucleic acid-binding protein
MFEDEQKLRLLSAAVKLQNIITTLDLNEEYQTMVEFYGSSTNTHQDKVQALEDANAILQVTLQSEHDDSEDLYISLNQTIYDMSKLVVQINNLKSTVSRH